MKVVYLILMCKVESKIANKVCSCKISLLFKKNSLLYIYIKRIVSWNNHFWNFECLFHKKYRSKDISLLDHSVYNKKLIHISVEESKIETITVLHALWIFIFPYSEYFNSSHYETHPHQLIISKKETIKLFYYKTLV